MAKGFTIPDIVSPAPFEHQFMLLTIIQNGVLEGYKADAVGADRNGKIAHAPTLAALHSPRQVGILPQRNLKPLWVAFCI